MMRSCAFLSVFLLALSLATPASAADYQPLKIVDPVNPVYPVSLQAQGIKTGDVQIVVYVDEQGKLEDYLVIGYSRKEFANAAVAAVKRWTFEPARMDGEPVPARQEVRFSFESEGLSVVSETISDHVERRFERLVPDLYRYRTYTLRDLDRLPVPRDVVAPSYPRELGERGIYGRVSVEFYIDETGRVRMPTVIESSHPELSVAAVLAVRQWRFEPPARQGRPAVVRAVQDFNFAPPK